MKTTKNIKKLQTNVFNSAAHARKKVRTTKVGLALGLWGPFVAALVLLALCVNGVIG